eukprot:1141113-Pelagomonas_calceolata.AAC.8
MMLGIVGDQEKAPGMRQSAGTQIQMPRMKQGSSRSPLEKACEYMWSAWGQQSTEDHNYVALEYARMLIIIYAARIENLTTLT